MIFPSGKIGNAVVVMIVIIKIVGCIRYSFFVGEPGCRNRNVVFIFLDQ